MDVLTGRQWRAEVAGLPCTVEAVDGGWVVVMASTTIGRGSDLAAAIVRAGGGVVSGQQARVLAESVAEALPRLSNCP